MVKTWQALAAPRGIGGRVSTYALGGFVDSALQPITAAKFEWVGRFHAGLAAVQLDGKVGLIRTDGTWAIEPKFDAAQPLQSDFALAKLGDRAGVIHIASGTWVTQRRYEDVCLLGRGLIGVMIDGKKGAIDASEHLVLAPRYAALAFNYFQDFVPAKSLAKWGFVDAAGNVIEAKFDEVSQFKRGVSWVKSGGEWCAIDRRGNRVPSLQCRSTAPPYIERPHLEQTTPCRIRP